MKWAYSPMASSGDRGAALAQEVVAQDQLAINETGFTQRRRPLPTLVAMRPAVS